MQNHKPKIRVLVVDDSLFARRMLSGILGSDPGILVVGEASNGQEAVDLVSVLRPDLVTMDVEMPVMGGLEAIERIMAKYPLPILVVTGLSTAATAFPAVSRGAIDVIAKPGPNPKSRENFLQKVHSVAGVSVKACLAFHGMSPVRQTESKPLVGEARSRDRIVAIASSTGGPQAIQAILSRLPGDFPAPIVIAQHIGDGFVGGMVEWLSRSTQLKLREAAHGDILDAGMVYFNPSEFAMWVDATGRISLGEREARLVYRPSCNKLLCSVAEAYQERSVGLILSGMGGDGVDGMLAIRKRGGNTLAQNADTSVVYGMNRLAVELGCIQHLLPLERISAHLMQLMATE